MCDTNNFEGKEIWYNICPDYFILCFRIANLIINTKNIYKAKKQIPFYVQIIKIVKSKDLLLT